MSPKRTSDLFDHWAENYDRAIQESFQGFPFEGYERTLERIAQIADPTPGMALLDIGVGTGALLSRFSSQDCILWGIDFAPRMLEMARKKMPNARLVLGDIQDEWPSELEKRFARVVSTYVMHHFELVEKHHIIRSIMRDLLVDDGVLIIGDISFRTREEFERNRRIHASEWDEEEYYWIAEEYQDLTRDEAIVTYEQVSQYSGIYVIQPM